MKALMIILAITTMLTGFAGALLKLEHYFIASRIFYISSFVFLAALLVVIIMEKRKRPKTN